MSWLLEADAWLFRLLNGRCTHPLLDAVVPLFSGNALFTPAVVALAIGLLWKGGVRGRIFVLVLAVALAFGDSLVINTLKHALARPRPFMELPDVRLLAGRGTSFSLPSSHAATWFAATLVAFVYYRRSLRFMLPLACLVCYSRVYLGVHYPSDVAAGAILGAGYAAACLVMLQTAWHQFGPAICPLWRRRLPNLLDPRPVPDGSATADPVAAERQWLNLALALLLATFAFRLAYIGSSVIQLSEDEAYQWTWSKHLALSYFSKPPMIAYLQWAGTHVWGDTQLGVRFLSPVMALALGWLLLRFTAREFGAQPALILVLVTTFTPLLAVGSTLLTVDPPLVLFWSCAMIAGWRAVQPEGSTRHWLLAGFCMGLAFLSKYSALYQILCFAIFMVLWPPARAHLRRAGPWLALGLVLLSTLPVFVWNAAHDWITVQHVATNAGLHHAWRPTLRFLGDFVGAELALLNPIILLAAAWAAVNTWRHHRSDPRLLFLFSMSVPVFAGHLLYALHSRVQPNWIAPAVLPLFLLGLGYWFPRWQAGPRRFPRWLTAALVLNITLVVVLHDSRLLGRLTSRPLPMEIDPLRRVRGWKETAALVELERLRLESEGQAAFIITAHYGMAGQLSFYLPQARQTVATRPLVYHRTAKHPGNQFFFWPGYREQRPGENAIYVRERNVRSRRGADLWAAYRIGLASLPPPPLPLEAPHATILEEFESVSDLGLHPVLFRGHVIRWVQLFACRNLKPAPARTAPTQSSNASLTGPPPTALHWPEVAETPVAQSRPHAPTTCTSPAIPAPHADAPRPAAPAPDPVSHPKATAGFQTAAATSGKAIRSP